MAPVQDCAVLDKRSIILYPGALQLPLRTGRRLRLSNDTLVVNRKPIYIHAMAEWCFIKCKPRARVGVPGSQCPGPWERGLTTPPGVDMTLW
ncbi:unnamed protein product [Gadus morhua 'NCC']